MDALSHLFGNLFPLFMVLAFVAVVLFIEGAYLIWNSYKGPEARRIEERLRALSDGIGASEHTSILKQRMLSATPIFEKILQAIPGINHFDKLLTQSGLNWTVAKFVTLTIAAAIAGYTIAMLAHVILFFALALSILTASFPFLFVYRKQQTRMRKLEQQLPDALDLISRALKAGHAFASGMKMVSDEMPAPIADEFRAVHDEVNFGISLQQALYSLGVRVPSTDLRYFVIAVLIQRDTGGNLTEVLGNLSALIRERLKLLAKVRVLSAEGRMSVIVLGSLPFALAGIINLLNPGFMAVLWTDSLGLKMVNSALFMMVMGIFWMRKIVKIHV